MGYIYFRLFNALIPMLEDGEQRSKGPSMGSGHQLRFISWWECPVLRCGLRVSEIAVMRSPASEASVQLSECHCINIYAVTGLGPVISLWTGNGRVTTSGQSGIPWPQLGWASIISRLLWVFRKSRKKYLFP